MIRKIAQFSINRPATVIILIAVLSIIGVMSVVQMRTDLLPEMDLPYAIVMTTYSGAGPEEIEEQVSKPIENVVATVSDIDTLMSQSSADSSIVIIGFNYGTNMDSAMADIRDKISLAESYLPSDADKPMVMKINPNIMPVIAIAIGSDQLSLAQLQSIAEDDIEPRLSRISGVASVTVLGGLEREVKVAVDPVKAQNYGLSLNQIGSFLAAENYNISSGDISFGEREYFVRSLQEFENVDAVGEVALTTVNGSKIQLKEIAEISEDYKEVEQLTRVNQKAAVSLLVQKATDGNTVEACTKVKEEMEKIQSEIGGKINVETVMDQSDFINKSLNSTTRTLAEGAVLAVLIIFLFMRNLRSTAIVGIAIPLSLLATFIVLFYNGSTLNTLTLGGLALGVGRMIDDSIVVFENIYRHRDQGLSAREAALKGTAEVGGAVLASTLTLIAVFLPIGLAGGITGVLFKPLALTICVAIGCSLMVSLAVVPFMSSRMLTDKAMVKKGAGKFFLSSLFHRLGKWLDNLGEKYKIWLHWALGHRRRVILSVVVLIALSLGMVPQIGAEFMPQSDSGEIEVTLEADKGAKLEDVDKLAAAVEAKLLQNPAVDIVYTTVGSSGEMAMMGAASNKASFRVQLIPKSERQGVEQVAEEIRQSLKDIFGAKSTVSVSSGLLSASSGGVVQINIQGDDLDTLRSLSKQIAGIVEKVPGTRNVTSSLGDGNPEVQLRLNRQRAMDFGLTPAQVSSEIKTAIDGTVVSRYRLEGDEIDITVTSTNKETSDMDTLKYLPILTAQGNSIPLSEVASFELSTGPVQIDRENQTRQGTISCDLSNRDLSSVTQDIQTGVSAIKLPAGYTIDYGGENEQMTESFSSLILALLMAIMLVYVVMVVQYESFRDPFVILFSLPGAIIGVVLALLVTGKSFSVSAFIGLIMLVGIAVANAIVYVDYLKQLLASGMERTAALLETGRVRLRPILMTALATILAMTPLAIGLGEGSETNAPLAIVVIGGLLAATFVTLFLVPVVYSILDDWSQKRHKKKSALIPELRANP
ncbi:efflux RND transporter permease subunit [Pelotomaculum terephthalicicum JT]|uniref:efflux RND transporter permease subunit n=1 Tax=Pelotomaculum terephthalicicum TaxID=206393 RepID=UPI001F040374|nr:efflux RND transporter permease subunit [Pelotomaculum terephthalicicum]MCG9968693.1 efflux RND transporter permease subunit [Pelotomaculum terephthalicicum JT]